MTAPVPHSQPSCDEAKRLINGEFYAKRDKIFRAPIETKTATGTNISVGFPVCHVSDYVDPSNLVECLNASREVDALKARIEELEGALREITDTAPYKTSGGGHRCRHCGYRTGAGEPERHNSICSYAKAKAALEARP